MVQEFIVLRNIVASQQERRKLAAKTRPANGAFLHHLLRSTATTRCEASVPETRSTMAVLLGSIWRKCGVCAQVVCGAVCISPKFLLAIDPPELHYYYGGPNDAGVEDGVERSQRRGACP